MKWIYILIVLVVASLASGCVDKEKAETQVKTPVPAQTYVSPGESAVTPAASASSQTPEDYFGAESNLSALDTTFDDMNMEISLLDSI